MNRLLEEKEPFNQAGSGDKIAWLCRNGENGGQNTNLSIKQRAETRSLGFAEAEKAARERRIEFAGSQFEQDTRPNTLVINFKKGTVSQGKGP